CAVPAAPAASAPRPPAAATAAPAAAGAPTAAPVASGPLSPPVTVHIGEVPTGANAAIYIALARGYYREEGIDITLEQFDTGDTALPALASGQIDMTVSGFSVGPLNAIARGLPLRIVAGMSRNEPGFSSSALVIRKDHMDSGRFRDYADLRGMRIALP